MHGLTNLKLAYSVYLTKNLNNTNKFHIVIGNKISEKKIFCYKNLLLQIKSV
jgi:hypothetical protein